MTEVQYHHGDLRRAVLDSALELIVEAGPGAVSLRALARRLGVSHAAPTHHFRTKEGVFTAIAAEGFTLFADALGAAPSMAMDDLGATYVRFCLDHRSHFAVMFRPDLFDGDDPAVVEPRQRAWGCLAEGAARAQQQVPPGANPEAVQLGAWALVHGFAALVAAGAVRQPDDQIETLVRQAAALMFRP